MLKLPSQDELKQRFYYDQETGDLIYKISPANRVKVGDIVKGFGSEGYRRVYIKGTLYKAHRIIWCWMTGEDLHDKKIDHKDRDRSNNKWNNLRKATSSDNGKNNKHPGYSKRSNGTWRVRVRQFGKCLFDKTVDTEEEARLLAIEKRAEFFGEYAPA